MNKKLDRLTQQLIPYLIAGIAIALVIGLFIMFSYVLIWGVIIGAVLWLIAFIKNTLFSGKKKVESKGRIIEHDEKD